MDRSNRLSLLVWLALIIGLLSACGDSDADDADANANRNGECGINGADAAVCGDAGVAEDMGDGDACPEDIPNCHDPVDVVSLGWDCVGTEYTIDVVTRGPVAQVAVYAVLTGDDCTAADGQPFNAVAGTADCWDEVHILDPPPAGGDDSTWRATLQVADSQDGIAASGQTWFFCDPANPRSMRNAVFVAKASRSASEVAVDSCLFTNAEGVASAAGYVPFCASCGSLMCESGG